MNNSLASIWIKDVVGLVSPPDICLKIIDLLNAGNATASDFGDIIDKDPGLTARVLRMVNSSFYQYPKKVDTVSRAVAIIGSRELQNLVLAVSAIKTFSKIPMSLINMDTFWRHSVFCGIISRILAMKKNILHPERLFIAGLLHDIGILVICSRAPEQMEELLIKAAGDEDRLYQAELEAFGFSHAELGGLLLESWQIPAILQKAVSYHHDPKHAGDAEIEASLLNIASLLANRSRIGAIFEDASTETGIDNEVWQHYQLLNTEIDGNKIISEAGMQFSEMIDSLLSE